MTPTNLVITALATYRLTKLVIDDEIMAELREKAYEFLDQYPDSLIAGKLTYFLSCPWCVSFYAAILVLLAQQSGLSPLKYLATALASSAATGILYERL